VNASSNSPVTNGSLSPANFGAWIRQLRESQGKLQRNLAAAAEMDSSHLGKVERGERLPTLDQALGFARSLGVDETAMKQRFAAVRLWRECGGDPAWVHAVAGIAQEAAAPYLVNNRGSNRAKKK